MVGGCGGGVVVEVGWRVKERTAVTSACFRYLQRKVPQTSLVQRRPASTFSLPARQPPILLNTSFLTVPRLPATRPVSLLATMAEPAAPAALATPAPVTNGTSLDTFPAPDAAGELVAAIAQAETVSAGKCSPLVCCSGADRARRDRPLRPSDPPLGPRSSEPVRKQSEPIHAPANGAGSEMRTSSLYPSRRSRTKSQRTWCWRASAPSHSPTTRSSPKKI